MAISGRGGEFFRVLMAMLVLAVVSVCMRIYVRVRLLKAFGIDDWFMVAALLGHIAYVVCAVISVEHGTGQHMIDLTVGDMVIAMKYWWLFALIYAITMMLAKISIGLFLLRVAVDRVHVWILRTAIVLSVMTGLLFFLMATLQCNPISHFWEQVAGAEGKCLNMNTIINVLYFYSAVSALCDITFGLLPVVLLWNLNMSRKTKLALAPILSMGCIASAGVIVRIVFLHNFRNPDFLYATLDIALWSAIEEGLAITAGSLATLRPLFRLALQKLSSFSNSGSNKTPGPSGSSKAGAGRGTPRRTPTIGGSHGGTGGGGGGGSKNQWSILHTEYERDEEELELRLAARAQTPSSATTRSAGAVSAEEDGRSGKTAWGPTS